jgi:hypothetical protein
MESAVNKLLYLFHPQTVVASQLALLLFQVLMKKIGSTIQMI